QVLMSSNKSITASFGLVGVEGEGPVIEFALGPPRPTPTSGSARIDYALPRECGIRLSVLDVQGREVTRLADGMQTAGRHQALWNEARVMAQPGVYTVRL